MLPIIFRTLGKGKGGIVGQRKSKLRGANATCVHCGKWATTTCSVCNKLICDICKREWPAKRARTTNGKRVDITIGIVTCMAAKCQASLSIEDRKGAVALLSTGS